MIHLITGEYPPTPGGVADYSAQVAHGLNTLGEEVHVWCPGNNTNRREAGATIHRIAGNFRAEDLRRLDSAIAQYSGPRRLLVQWVPHSYGPRALNFRFALWLWKRAHTHRDTIELMVHEPFVAFEGSLRRRLAACIHRAMAVILLDAAKQVWVSIPAWETRLRPWSLRNSTEFSWLPVPSNIAPTQRLAPTNPTPVIGHFGTYGKSVADLLEPLIVNLLTNSNAKIILAGNNSDRFLAQLAHPDVARRVIATGALPAEQVAKALVACDLMLQPYPDGISTRRGSAMCALALGIPLVSNFGHLSEPFWRETSAARIAETPETCAQLALELLRDEPLRRRTSAAARTLYDDNFHLRHTLAAIVPQPAIAPKFRKATA